MRNTVWPWRRPLKRPGYLFPGGLFLHRSLRLALLPDSGRRRIDPCRIRKESLSDAVLQAYRKPFRVGQVFEAHAAAMAAGLYVAHYILLGGPGETPSTMVETLERLERLDKCALFFFCGMRSSQTDLYEIHVKTGSQGHLAMFWNRSLPVAQDLRPRALDRVQERAGGRLNWIIGDGGEQTAGIISKMHARGYSGPLWELCVR